MRSHEEFKKEVFKRKNIYKKKRNNRIKGCCIVLCLGLSIPTIYKITSPRKKSEVNNTLQKGEEGLLVYDDFLDKDEYVFRKKENIQTITNYLDELDWKYSEIAFIGKEKKFKLINEDIIEFKLIDQTLVYENKWIKLDEEQDYEFKMMIINLNKEE